ncbi:MAG TPA: AAA family ATPase [Oscillatoriales cyanobacterium M59_W2019_021]|nr:AAA family ATPase [Oscillatoriales cyanobacterium M59_W2019_021]
MKAIPGYKVRELVYEGSKTIVYRGQRESDGQPVILKLLKKELPSLKELALFRHQYALLQPHDLPGIVKPCSLENYQNGYLLVMEDDGSISLQKWREYQGNRRPLTIADFLTIAVQIAQILDGLHRNWIVHKDIKPANILIHPDTKQVKLIDFSIASVLPRETQTVKHPNVLEGTLAYLSPEQTGRMNRGIDYRTDFYSLGIAFYELLAGELPFQCHDPMELLHCHLARHPQPLASKREDIPAALSNIVRKLMAKNPEDRYQSALGLKFDLEQCLYQWKETGKIELLELGMHDRADRFLIPEKLYGREREVETLLQAFARVAGTSDVRVKPFQEVKSKVYSLQCSSANGLPPNPKPQTPNPKSEVMLVTGFSGIGKTAVINEIHKPIVASRGYFIKGKFDQFQRDIPFSALVRALKDLIEQLLTESPAEVEAWKAKILEAVGESGQVVIDVIPELEYLIGKQPEVPELDEIATQNRFNWIFGKFIQVFPSAEHPLVMFLDDLQWADVASLQFLQVLMGNSDLHHFLLLGAYRDNEVSPAHPAMLAIEEIRKAGVTVNTITLTPLQQEDLNRLIADTLGCPLDIALPLTQLVEAKTQSNPFFSRQFLHALYDENLIYFNREHQYWECDLTQVRSMALSDDVVEFMAAQLQKLPEETQEVLQFAACMGNRFDLETLAIVCEQNAEVISQALWHALQAELIVPMSQTYQFNRSEICPLPMTHYSFSNYQFLHDRVQQAAYSTIGGDRQQSVHLKIGQLLKAKTDLNRQSETLFEIVNHLNLGMELIEAKGDRTELSQLNLAAGQKAISSITYDSALNYLNTGIQLLASDSWEAEYDLTLKLYETAAEAAYLSGEFDLMEAAIEIVQNNARSLLDQIPVYEIQIKALGAQNKSLEAVQTGLSILKLLGIDLPESPTEADTQQALADIQTKLADRSMEDLLHLPEMQDPQMLAGMRILSNTIQLAYQAVPNLFFPILFQQLNLSFRYGNTALSSLAYVTYGFVLCGVLENIELGSKLGQLSLDLLTFLSDKSVKAKVPFTYLGGIGHWTIFFKKNSNFFLETYSVSLETGDLNIASYSLLYYNINSYICGENLSQVEQKIATCKVKINSLKQASFLNYTTIYQHLILRLQGIDYHWHNGLGEKYDETEILVDNDVTGLFHLHFSNLILSYFKQDFATAIDNANDAEQYLAGVAGQMVVPQFHFYDSLARLADSTDRNEAEQQEILEKVAAYQKKMKKWAHHAPMNFLNKYYLIEAEYQRVLGNKLEAIELYDRSIMLAKKNDFVHEEALAYELAAKFYLELDKTSLTRAYATLAQSYMEKAYYAYDLWGAKAKLKDLEQRYPQLLTFLNSWESWGLKDSNSTIVSLPKFSGTTTSFSSSSSIVEALDLATVIKASQALSGELELRQSIETLMRILLENVGAQTGALILHRNGELAIEARASKPDSDDLDLQITSLQSIPIQSTSDIPLGLIHYVWRTSQTIVLDDAVESKTFATDPYICEYQPQSVLCTPICNQGKTIGLLYLENNLTRGAFTRDRLDFLKFLTTQAAISLENASLYQDLMLAKERLEDANQNLEEKVAARTQELKEKNQCLEKTLKKLKRTQAQLIQSEKMSGLGQLVAGVAHEINNPVSFISGNLFHANEYLEDLLTLIEVYQQEYPIPTPTIQDTIEQIDLEFLISDLPKLMNSMKMGCDRIKKIVLGLRNFSRLDESDTKEVDLHEGLENSLMLLQNRLEKKGDCPAIQVIKEYGKLPEVNCYASQINQVFLNILNNAIDALEEVRVPLDLPGTEQQKTPQIRIHTEVIAENQVCIRIADNGVGMTEEVKNKVFDPFFTTKPIGKGTGLGMSISYQIIVEKHGGSIECHSVVNQGTEWDIYLPIEYKFDKKSN